MSHAQRMTHTHHYPAPAHSYTSTQPRLTTGLFFARKTDNSLVKIAPKQAFYV